MYFIPQPKKVEELPGVLKIDAEFELFHNKFRGRKSLVALFSAFKETHGLQLDLTPIQDHLLDRELSDDFFFLMAAPRDRLAVVNEILKEKREVVPREEEGYYIQITGTEMFLASWTEQGFYYGIQTLVQMVSQIQPGRPVVVPQLVITDHPTIPLRGFHLDLKMIMHSFKYLKGLIGTLGHYKYNALIVEYEDKFPYRDAFEVLRHKYCLTGEQIESLKSACARNYIEVIPLVQTFGHVEFVIKHEEFKHLREIPDLEDGTLSYCPLHEKSFETARNMIQQVARAHPGAKYFHIGADEVYQLGSCLKCKAFVEEHSHSQLYIDFINKVAAVVKAEDKIPVMWSDYLIKYPEVLETLDKDIVVMYWIYGCTEKDEAAGTALPKIPRFHELGHKVMGAPSTNSDFTLTVPQYAKRFENMGVHARLSAKYETLGVVVTSWPVCGNPYEVQWPGILWHAQVTWDPSYSHTTEYDKFSQAVWRVHYGVAEEDLELLPSLLTRLVNNTEKISRDNYLDKVEGIPPFQQELDLAIKKSTRNQTSLVALLHGLGGLGLQADYYQTLASLEEYLAEVDEAGTEIPPEEITRFKRELQEFLDDVNEYYAETRRLYEDTNIIRKNELIEVYEQERYFGTMKANIKAYMKKIDQLPGNLEELLLDLFRGTIRF